MMKHRKRLLLALGGAGLGAVVVWAFGSTPYVSDAVGEPPGHADRQVAAQGAVVGDVGDGRAGLLIGRDPRTGQLRGPTAEEVQAMTALAPDLRMNRSTAGLRQVVKPDGSIEMDLQGRFQSFALANVAQDGSVLTECVTTEEEAKAFLNTSATSETESDDEE